MPDDLRWLAHIFFGVGIILIIMGVLKTLRYFKLNVKRSTTGLDQKSFLANDEKQRAVCMTLINIGEAVKQLSAQLKLKYKGY